MVKGEAKKRIPIPRITAAKILFEADRTCCVCRAPGKKLQIHHIDDNPSNNQGVNLATLCLECHGDTQLSGGFGRKLDPDQIILYRDDWNRIVAGSRLKDFQLIKDQLETENDRVAYLTSVAEALREANQYGLLAHIYHSIGNSALRDKYIDLALGGEHFDEEEFELRGLQGRPDLVPASLAERVLSAEAERGSWTERARSLNSLGRRVEAADDYVRGIRDSFDERNYFAAGYYLKELVSSGLIKSLFERALDEATLEGDVWWQVRSLQELGWGDELRALLIDNATEIEQSGNPELVALLLDAQGRRSEARKMRLDRWQYVRISRVGQPDDVATEEEPHEQ